MNKKEVIVAPISSACIECGYVLNAGQHYILQQQEEFIKEKALKLANEFGLQAADMVIPYKARQAHYYFQQLDVDLLIMDNEQGWFRMLSLFKKLSFLNKLDINAIIVEGHKFYLEEVSQHFDGAAQISSLKSVA